MTTYKVSLLVSAKQLPVLLQVIQGTAGIDLLNLDTADGGPTKTRKPSYFVGGKRLKGITGKNLVLKTLEAAKGPVSMNVLRSAFKTHGFAESSSSSSVSFLKAAKQVVQDGDKVRLATLRVAK